MKGYEQKHWDEGGKGCPSLVEMKGRYWCGLYLDAAGKQKTHIKNELSIGIGCCSSLNSDRLTILRKRKEAK